MKLILLIIVHCCISGSISGQRLLTEIEKQKRDYCLYLAKTYCSDANYILASDLAGSYAKSVDGSDREEWKRNFHWAVYVTVMDMNKETTKKIPKETIYSSGLEYYQQYYLKKNIFIRCPTGFKTLELGLGDIIHDSLKKEILRYKHYVGDTNRYFWYQGKIFNLISNFSAHYQGFLADFELRKSRVLYTNILNRWTTGYDPVRGKYRRYEGRGTSSYMLDLVTDEKLFLSWYLRYAKEVKPAVYEEIFKNTNLRIAYTLLDDQLENLMKIVQQDTLLVRLYITNHLQFMSEESKQELIQFRLPGITHDNYQKYLIKY